MISQMPVTFEACRKQKKQVAHQHRLLSVCIEFCLVQETTMNTQVSEILGCFLNKIYSQNVIHNELLYRYCCTSCQGTRTKFKYMMGIFQTFGLSLFLKLNYDMNGSTGVKMRFTRQLVLITEVFCLEQNIGHKDGNSFAYLCISVYAGIKQLFQNY